MKRGVVARLVATASVSAVTADAQTSWSERVTDHFEIHYRRGQTDSLVNAVASEAERAYARVSFGLG